MYTKENQNNNEKKGGVHCESSSEEEANKGNMEKCVVA